MKNQIAGKQVREISIFNNMLVTDLLYNGSFSCMELSQKTMLTHAALVKIIERLVGAAVIIRDEDSSLSRGRGGQHVRYRINENKGIFILINFSYDNEHFYIYDFSGKELFDEKIELDDLREKIIPQERVREIADYVRVKSCEFGREVLAVSIAIPGQVNETTGEFFLTSRFDRTLNIKKVFKEYFDAIVTVKNDTAYGAIFECEEGLLKDKESALYINVGYGISSCLTHNGELLTLKKTFSGEIGRNFVTCENMSLHNCCSIASMSLQLGMGLLSDNYAGFMQAYKTNPVVKERVLKSARILGAELCAIMNLTGCDTIVFSGKVCEFGEEYFSTVRSAISKFRNKVGVYPITVQASKQKNPIKNGLFLVAKRETLKHIFL